MREMVNLVCADCGSKNYQTGRDKKKSKEKIEVSKYCPRCRKHAVHKEGKV